MEFKYVIVGAILLMLVAFSGCTLPGQGGGGKSENVVEIDPNNGVHVKIHSTTKLIGGENYRIELEILNVGQAEVSNIKVTPPAVLYDLTSGSVSIDNRCGGKTLKPPVPDKKKPGDSCKVIIRGTIKSVDREYTYSGNDYKFSVQYSYSTEAKVKIPLYGKGIVNKKRKEGTLPSSEPITENSYAPIKFYVRGKPYLIAGEENYLRIEARNVGNGELEVDNYGRQFINRIDISIPSYLGSIRKGDCDSGIQLPLGGYSGYCEFSVIPRGDNNLDTMLPVTIKSSYTYITYVFSTIQVVPY